MSARPDDTTRSPVMSRRDFQRVLAGAAMSGLLAGTAVRPCGAATTTSPPPPAGRFIDIHTHLGQPWYGLEPLSASKLLRWMDRHDVARAVVLPLVSPEAYYYPVSTDFVLRETRPHRDRLVPFCAIDPRTAGTHLPTHRSLVDMLRRYVDAGARGFGEHKPRLPIDDPLNGKLYRACGEVKLPVLFHLDNFANMDRPGLPGLARMLAEFPDTHFIGHGKGWWASIAGGLKQADLHVGFPEGPVAPGGAIDALMEKYPNIHGDLSSSGAHAVTRDVKFGREFLIRRADHLLFGTDYYELGQKFPHFELFEKISVPAGVEAKISRDNARRILRLVEG